MTTLWANIALTPTNGFSMLTHCHRLYLPFSADTNTMAGAWQQLVERYARMGVSLPDALAALSPPHYSLLSFFCSEWARAHTSSADVNRLVVETIKLKLIPEVSIH
jgi:hypothetical protein